MNIRQEDTEYDDNPYANLESTDDLSVEDDDLFEEESPWEVAFEHGERLAREGMKLGDYDEY